MSFSYGFKGPGTYKHCLFQTSKNPYSILQAESHPMVKKWKKRTGQKTSALFIMCHSHDKGRLMGIKAVGYVIDEFTV